MQKVLALAPMLCLASNTGMADASTFCVYSLLAETHSMVLQCGDPLPAAAELRYQHLITETRKKIIHNTHAPGKQRSDVQKSLAQYDSTIRARYQKVSDNFCKSNDYADYREMLMRFTSAENSSKVLAGLEKSKKGPNEGECI